MFFQYFGSIEKGFCIFLFKIMQGLYNKYFPLLRNYLSLSNCIVSIYLSIALMFQIIYLYFIFNVCFLLTMYLLSKVKHKIYYNVLKFYSLLFLVLP